MLLPFLFPSTVSFLEQVFKTTKHTASKYWWRGQKGEDVGIVCWICAEMRIRKEEWEYSWLLNKINSYIGNRRDHFCSLPCLHLARDPQG